jgi:hypothetical protein
LLSATPLERTGLHDDPVDLRFLADGSLLAAGQRHATRARLWWLAAAAGLGAALIGVLIAR